MYRKNRNRAALLVSRLTKDYVSAKIIAANTLRIVYKDGSEAIRLHDTDVVTFNKSNVTLNSGTWRTPTTKSRINDHSPVQVSQSKGIWYVGGHVFYDGITFDSEGALISEPKDAINLSAANKLRKQIKGYINMITEDNLPVPCAGDCLYCRQTTEGQALGDATGNHEHLQSHLDEGYLHGSVLVSAMRDAGYGDEQIRFHYGVKLVGTFKRSVRRYIQKRLLPEVVTR